MVGLFDKCDNVNVSYCKYKTENTQLYLFAF